MSERSSTTTFNLYARRVEHHTEGGAHGLRGQVVDEPGPHETAVAVGAGDAAPDDPDLGALLLLVAPVDEGDPLAEVELSVLLLLDTLDGDEGDVGVLGTVAPLEAHEGALGVESVLRNAGEMDDQQES